MLQQYGICPRKVRLRELRKGNAAKNTRTKTPNSDFARPVTNCRALISALSCVSGPVVLDLAGERKCEARVELATVDLIAQQPVRA